MTNYKFTKFIIMFIVFVYLLAGAYNLVSNTRTITIKGGGAVLQKTTKQALQETMVGVDNSLIIDPVDYTGISYMSKNIEAIIYGYNSEKCQTDDTPNITASGQKTRDRIIANNCLAFGTKVKIDNKIYEVQDRMNSKYTQCDENDIWYFDIWFAEKQDALNWGHKQLSVLILNK